MDLPQPVSRYFRYAFDGGIRMIRHAIFKQRGTMRATATGGWSPFSATQEVFVSPRQYEWHAVMRIAGFIPLSIFDGYHNGVGISRASFGGILTLAQQQGTPEMNSASLLRFLAEGAWTPSILLPESGVMWRAIDASSAQASLADNGTTVTLAARFGNDGRMLEIQADRYRAVKTGAVLTPWRGVWTEYRRIEDIVVPTAAEVSWQLDGAWTPVWRGSITSAHYSL